MEPKEYQRRGLTIIDAYLTELRTWRERFEAADQDLRDAIDYPKAAWSSVTKAAYHSRTTGAGEPLPTFCLKVPTGGGKTYLAVRALDRVFGLYLRRQTGLVLWIVPTDQIYRQTLNALRTRTHPYRQFLDMATGGRVAVMEKGDAIKPQDVRERLAIMMLMLPSANRRDKDTLRVFQDTSALADFFPDEGDLKVHQDWLERWPNLDCFGASDPWNRRQIKTSLGNVLRISSPVVVLDEGQKAYSDGAQNTIRGLNPSVVLELSATPPRASNILVNIKGRELDSEDMIKLDLHVANRPSLDWRDTLADSVGFRVKLEADAVAYQARTGSYIRPICLIQVERTGKDQVESGHIHAEHVKSELVLSHGVAPAQIAIKSSEQNDIEDVDLLSPDCQIRYIVTKQALQEGWDCSFAYVLTVLTKPNSATALTQLVGRILRQPYARKTGVSSLDESYVFCFRREAAELSKAIKQGLEDEGLGDLSHSVSVGDALPDPDGAARSVGVRERFRQFDGHIYLPRFIVVENDREDELSYEMDLLSRVDWGRLSLDSLDTLTLAESPATGWVRTFGYRDDADEVRVEGNALMALSELNLPYVSRRIEGLVSNPWVARAVVERALDKLTQRYCRETVAGNQVLIAEELARILESERDRLCEDVFRQMVHEGTLCLVLVHAKAYMVPSSIVVPTKVEPLYHSDGGQIQLSLFADPVPKPWFNDTLEAPVALCLDRHEKLLFWFRNLTGKDYFYVQGWRRNRVWADFVAARKSNNDASDFDTIYVLETKGTHLAGNADTTYKAKLFDLCNELAWSAVCAGFPEKVVHFQVVEEAAWQRVVNDLMAPRVAPA